MIFVLYHDWCKGEHLFLQLIDYSLYLIKLRLWKQVCLNCSVFWATKFAVSKIVQDVAKLGVKTFFLKQRRQVLINWTKCAECLSFNIYENWLFSHICFLNFIIENESQHKAVGRSVFQITPTASPKFDSPPVITINSLLSPCDESKATRSEVTFSEVLRDQTSHKYTRLPLNLSLMPLACDICLKQGQGMSGRAAPPHPEIYRVTPPPPRAFTLLTGIVYHRGR